jgi:UDP-N-acetylmuramate dehydrogenase
MAEHRDNLARFRALAARRLEASRLRRDIPLAPYTTFRIGGPADLLYDATTADDLANAVETCREAELPHFVLGLGANILIGDKGFRGAVIRNVAREFRYDGNQLWAESGAVMQDLILSSVHRGLSGLEHYIGIPSTVGGAVWQNLHFLSPAPERERTMFIAEVFDSCEVLSQEGGRRVVHRDEMAFGYDTSILHHRHDVALSVTFNLTQGDRDRMNRILQENLSWRGARHPWLEIHPSAGSIFKKIEGVGAGRLIDQCGLKGHRVGDAQVSYLHANIVINLGEATAADIRQLIAEIQRRVADQFGQHLEPEIGFVGEF